MPLKVVSVFPKLSSTRNLGPVASAAPATTLADAEAFTYTNWVAASGVTLKLFVVTLTFPPTSVVVAVSV